MVVDVCKLEGLDTMRGWLLDENCDGYLDAEEIKNGIVKFDDMIASAPEVQDVSETIKFRDELVAYAATEGCWEIQYWHGVDVDDDGKVDYTNDMIGDRRKFREYSLFADADFDGITTLKELQDYSLGLWRRKCEEGNGDVKNMTVAEMEYLRFIISATTFFREMGDFATAGKIAAPYSR